MTGPPTTDAVTRHYTDTGDNPTWVEHTTGTGTTAVTTSTRYAETLGGDLGLEITSTPGGSASPDIKLPIANPHGDTVTTIAVPVTGTGATATLGNATCIGAWADYDEYGNAKTPATGGVSGSGTVAAASGGVGYAWLGNKQRATDPTSGLILMGARLYNKTTGQFTSLDPVYGGNTTNYSYPQDPINGYDLDGRWWGWRKTLRYAAIGAGIVGAIACGASVVCGVAVGAAAGLAAYSATHAGTSSWSWRSAGYETAIGAASGLGWGRMGRYFGHSGKNAKWLGFKFSSSPTARGTDMAWRGRRVFGIHSHRIAGHSWAKFIHYHRRGPGGIGSHRPWDGRW